MASAEESKTSEPECALDHKVKDIDGKEVNLHDYEGKVVLVVNVASRCGYTSQYAGLEALYKKYEDKGLVVLGFPCNQFGSQEPGSNADVKSFCKSKYGVTFPMFSKIEVNGPGADPFYKGLTSADAKPKGKGSVRWNFEKFLLDREGNVVGRYGSGTTPMGEELTKAIESALNS